MYYMYYFGFVNIKTKKSDVRKNKNTPTVFGGES